MSFLLASFSRISKLATAAAFAIATFDAFSLYLRTKTPLMMMMMMIQDLSMISKSNAAALGEGGSSLKGGAVVPVAVFVGGTSGIGQGITEAFARWRNGKAHIIIVGRNAQAASDIIAQFPTPADPMGQAWSYEFVECDATLMKNVRAAAQKILAKHSKINYLVMSQGFMSTYGRDETEEGIDKKLAVHYYSRWKFIDELLPALRRSREDGEDARVLSVLHAGYGGKIDIKDLGLKKGYSVMTASLATATYNDLMVESFAERNPGITFVHAFPGGVLTNLLFAARSPWIRIVAPVVNCLASFFAFTKEQCAEHMWFGLLNRGDGAFRFDSKARNVGERGYYGDEEKRRKLWEHTVEATKV